jgi:hypothetical protein
MYVFNFHFKINIIVYTTFYTVQYFLCVTFMYTLYKAEISSINLLKPYVRLQIYNFPFYTSDIQSLKMVT